MAGRFSTTSLSHSPLVAAFVRAGQIASTRNTINVPKPVSTYAAAVRSSMSINSIMQDGFAVEREFVSLQESLRAPTGIMNSSACKKIEGFLAQVLKLWARIKQFQLEHGGHVAFAVFPYDLAGQGQLQSPMARRKVLVSQVLRREKRGADGEVEKERACLT